ncbi:FecR family protein [Achromobacter sp. SD115]|uniref:FecR family protein n=1 Tax=Achromobacter sp. SD115 TaxID=2782011 RepID=UPI001A97BE61|nr:FecR family protein [Achromobacter sp. SD115]MBO1016500.1 FecR family protein [Achromobacter sp. SD115]
MAVPPTTFSGNQDDLLTEQAVEWCVRIHDESCSERDRAALQAWLEADPRHAREYEAVRDLWLLSRELPAAPATGAAPAPTSRTPRPYTRWALGACALTLGCWAAGWWFALLPSAYHRYASGTQMTTVTLGDGSEVDMNIDTSMVYRNYRDTRRVRLSDGEAYFRVSHDANQPFVVEAGRGTITVTGTAFNVWKSGDTVVVTLLEGSVDLRTDTGGRKVSMQALTQARYTERNEPQTRTVSGSASTAWRNGKLVLDNTTLRDAIMQINRYLPVEARYTSIDPAIAGLRLGGTYEIRNVAELAQALPNILPVRSLRRPDGSLALVAGPAP